MQKVIIKNVQGKLLEEIIRKSNNAKEAINVNEILKAENAGYSTTKLIYKNLFQLYLDGLIDIEPNRREKNIQQLIYHDTSAKQKVLSSDMMWNKINEWLNLYIKIIPKPSLNDFIKLTKGKLIRYELFSFLKKINADIKEVSVLLNTVSGFYAGQHPVLLTDMGLNSFDLANYTHLLNAGESPLLKQELLKTRIDIDGISCSTIVTKRTLELIQNKPIQVLIEGSKTTMLFYTYRQHKLLQEKELYFRSFVNKVFNGTCSLINQSGINVDTNISLLLYGPSGTGKTEFAFQLAKKVEADIMQLNYSQIHSKWIGETEKNIRKVFAEYDEKRKNSGKPLILLFNEADGLMNKRVNIQTSNDVFANQSQTQLLEILEEFKGILIATTNLYHNIDEAFHRRFLFRCFLDLPDDAIKRTLLQKSPILKYLSKATLDKLSASTWSAAQLNNLERKTEQLNLLNELTEDDVIEFLKQDDFLKPKLTIGFR